MSRANPTFYLAVILWLASSASFAGSNDNDPCDGMDYAPALGEFRLQSTKLDSSGVFTGTFELTNRSMQAIRIAGFKKAKVFVVDRPYIDVEYQDLQARWQRLLTPPGTYTKAPDELVIEVGKSTSISVPLITQDLANRSARPFRLLLRINSSSKCMVSASFEGAPSRQRVDKLVTTGARS